MGVWVNRVSMLYVALNRVTVDDQSKGLDRIKHDDDAYTFGKHLRRKIDNLTNYLLGRIKQKDTITFTGNFPFDIFRQS